MAIRPKFWKSNFVVSIFFCLFRFCSDFCSDPVCGFYRLFRNAFAFVCLILCVCSVSRTLSLNSFLISKPFLHFRPTCFEFQIQPPPTNRRKKLVAKKVLTITTTDTQSRTIRANSWLIIVQQQFHLCLIISDSKSLNSISPLLTVNLLTNPQSAAIYFNCLVLVFFKSNKSPLSTNASLNCFLNLNSTSAFEHSNCADRTNPVKIHPRIHPRINTLDLTVPGWQTEQLQIKSTEQKTTRIISDQRERTVIRQFVYRLPQWTNRCAILRYRIVTVNFVNRAIGVCCVELYCGIVQAWN